MLNAYMFVGRMFADALRQFSKPTFGMSKMLRVRFIVEAAVDEGGPRREFFPPYACYLQVSTVRRVSKPHHSTT